MKFVFYLWIVCCVSTVRPPALKGHRVAQHLHDVRSQAERVLTNRGPESQVAAIEFTDAALNPIHFNAIEYKHPIGRHIKHWSNTEVYLITEMESYFVGLSKHPLRSGYAFLYAHNSPCATCLCFIYETASHNQNVIFYIGYTQPYGRGNRLHTVNERHKQFRFMMPYFVPNNVHFVHIPFTGSVRWITRDKIKDIKKAGQYYPPRYETRSSFQDETNPTTGSLLSPLETLEVDAQESDMEWLERFKSRHLNNKCDLRYKAKERERFS